MRKYIFLDTFALNLLTSAHYDALSQYLDDHDLVLVITPMLLVEYFSPMLQAGDRTDQAIQLLMKHDFVIANQDTVMDREESAYPAAVARLPVAYDTMGSFDALKPGQRFDLLYQLFHHGIPGSGYDPSIWAANHRQNKATWKDAVDAILKNALLTGTLAKKADFIQSLDIRLCNGLELAARQLKGLEKPDRFYPERLKKLNRILDKRDTRIMKGVHLSSLITWYDYVIANKKIKD